MKPTRLPYLCTERCQIRLLEPSEANIMASFRVQNREHLREWEPTRSADFYTPWFWERQLRASLHDFREGHSVCLAILSPAEDEVYGVCNYTNIVRGTFQSCHLGYAMSEQHQGQGLMKEALSKTNRYMFDELKLHRVMANYLPRNERSGALLRQLGFETEGKARKYLKINGVWEDHILTSLINPASG